MKKGQILDSDVRSSDSIGTFPFDIVIGLEVHIQLNTNTKLFCSCKNSFGGLPNHHSCPVCLGLPGVLPVLNKQAVDSAIAMGLAINGNIRNTSVFARKQYFYPDLPKGYQITQYDLPYCSGGEVILDSGRLIEVERIHIEEDAGKSVHSASGSFVDLNRAGTPLLEMVSKPVLRTPEEAGEYLKKVRSIVRYLGISDGNMEEGSFRCDANISLKPKGASELGTRTEIKNVNSFKNVERALSYEILRQADILSSGGVIVQETLRFDAEAGKTKSNRSKEQTADYRYFPEPDLGPLVISDERIQRIKDSLPELAPSVHKRYVEKLDISDENAGILTSEKEVSVFFEEVISHLEDFSPKLAANFVVTEYLRAAREGNWDLESPAVDSQGLAELLNQVGNGSISGKIAKTVFPQMVSTGKGARDIIKDQNLAQVSDSGEISSALEEILEQNPKQVQSYLDGKEKIMGFFVGQVMKKSGGKLNPGLVNKILKEKLDARKQSG